MKIKERLRQRKQEEIAARREHARENQRLYEGARKEVLDIKLSNQQAYDKTIISFSGAIVAASVGFFTSHQDVKGWVAIILLISSWVSFAAAIVAVLRSLHLGNQASDARLQRNHEYYLEDRNEDECSNEDERLTTKTNDWNRYSGIAFATGIILTILFASVFLIEKGWASNMGKETRLTEGLAPSSITKKREINGGVTLPPMQKKVTKGQPSQGGGDSKK